MWSDGIVTIPLPAYSLERDGAPVSNSQPPCGLGELIIGPENGLVEVVFHWAIGGPRRRL